MTSSKKEKYRRWPLLITLFGLGALCVIPTMNSIAEENGTNDAIQNRTAVKRDPFWPVGYSPDKGVQERRNDSTMTISSPIESTWENARKHVDINGVSRISEEECFAIINGEVKAVGDQVSIQLGNTVYTWIVDNIEPPSRVQLRRSSAQ